MKIDPYVLASRCGPCFDFTKTCEVDWMNLTQDQVVEHLIAYHKSDHDPDYFKPAQPKNLDWVIQEVQQEGAPFLLYKGVIVGRLYGGCPYKEMLEKLNA